MKIVNNNRNPTSWTNLQLVVNNRQKQGTPEALNPDSVFKAWHEHGVYICTQAQRRDMKLKAMEDVLDEGVSRAIDKAYKLGYRAGRLSLMPNLVATRPMAKAVAA